MVFVSNFFVEYYNKKSNKNWCFGSKVLTDEELKFRVAKFYNKCARKLGTDECVEFMEDQEEICLTEDNKKKLEEDIVDASRWLNKMGCEDKNYKQCFKKEEPENSQNKDSNEANLSEELIEEEIIIENDNEEIKIDDIKEKRIITED